MDVLAMDSFVKDLSDSNFEVAKIIPKKFHYGIILSGDLRYLIKDFREYMRSIRIESFSKQLKHDKQDMKVSLLITVTLQECCFVHLAYPEVLVITWKTLSRAPTNARKTSNIIEPTFWVHLNTMLGIAWGIVGIIVDVGSYLVEGTNCC